MSAREGPVLAIDLGGTRLRAAVADGDGTILARDEEPVRDPDPGELQPRIVEFGRTLISKAGAAVQAVGVSTPGLVDGDAGVVVGARNLGWRNVRLGLALAEGFGAPTVIENDANCAALGEEWRGAGRGHRDLVYVSIGTGVGAGILAGGALVRGARFAAGELGRLPYASVETVEDVAGGPGIVRRARERGLDVLTTANVYDVAAAGDAQAAEVVRDAVAALATAVTAVIVVLDPGVVVVGGGVAGQGERLLAPLREDVARRLTNPCPIILSELGGDAQLFGAMSLALRLAGAAG